MELKEQRELLKQEQELKNKLREGDVLNAALLAFKLNRPQTLFKAVNAMTASEKVLFVDQVVQNSEGVELLLKRVRDWNVVKRYAGLAQSLLTELFERVPYSHFPDLPKLLGEIKVYSEKHYSRIEKLYMHAFYFDHLINELALRPQKRLSTTESAPTKRVHIS